MLTLKIDAFELSFRDTKWDGSGARDFFSAFSGFYQVFIVTRVASAYGRRWSAFVQHRKFPPHARKTSGIQSRDGLSTGINVLARKEVTVQRRKFVMANSTDLDCGSLKCINQVDLSDCHFG